MRVVYWSSPTHCVVDTGTHYRDQHFGRATFRTFVAWFWSQYVLRQRDPFFHREDYQ